MKTSQHHLGYSHKHKNQTLCQSHAQLLARNEGPLWIVGPVVLFFKFEVSKRHFDNTLVPQSWLNRNVKLGRHACELHHKFPRK